MPNKFDIIFVLYGNCFMNLNFFHLINLITKNNVRIYNFTKNLIMIYLKKIKLTLYESKNLFPYFRYFIRNRDNEKKEKIN